jgi:hypothetical protein
MNLLRRILFVAWQDPTSRRIFPVARLLDRMGATRWEFAYLQGAREAVSCGFAPFHGFGELDHVTLSEELPPFFTNRLMRKSRPDFPSYMTSLGLPVQGEDEIPILARSEGFRASDTIELFGLPVFDETLRVYRFRFFARGVRHVAGAEERIHAIRAGDDLELQDDPENAADRLAIRVHERISGPVGFVPRTLLEDIHELRTKGSKIRVLADQVNLDPAPAQLRLLCALEASEVPEYLPFASDRYTPIAAEATSLRYNPRELVG